MSLVILHQTVSVLDLLKTEDFPRIRIKFLSRHHSYYLRKRNIRQRKLRGSKNKAPEEAKVDTTRHLQKQD